MATRVLHLTRTTLLPLLGLAIALAMGHVGADRGLRADQERFLYVATIAQSATDPDFVAVIGADPRRGDFGRIVDRVDMPNVGDELHHFGYSADQKRLIVPGLFSGRVHVFDVRGNGRKLTLRAVNDRLVTDSGYIVPHSVIATTAGRALVTMIGAATGTTRPGGIVEIDDATGAFTSYFGPGPVRDAGELGPHYMYDFDSLADANVGISTTFGPPRFAGAASPRRAWAARSPSGTCRSRGSSRWSTWAPTAARSRCDSSRSPECGGRSSTRRAPARCGWPATMTGMACSPSSRCSARPMASRCRWTCSCRTTTASCT